MDRRALLQTIGVGTVGLSGCLGGRENTQTAEIDCPETTPSTATATPCEGNWQRHGAYTSDGVRYESGAGFELSVTPTEISFGDCVRFRLKNVSNGTKTTGNDRKYDIHRRTDDGWQSVLFTKRAAFTDEAIGHRPGMGFFWNRRFSRAGFTGDETGRFRACEPLVAGQYRFVYWGVSGENFDALGVQFDVEE